MSAKQRKKENQGKDKERAQEPTIDEIVEEIADAAEACADEIEEAIYIDEFGEQWKEQFLRLTADFDNYRKRMAREKEDWSRYASLSMIEKLIPVVDNLDAAASAVTGAGQGGDSMAEGFLMIHKQMNEILAREGLAEIPAEGEDFDPNVHEAVMTVARTAGQKDNQVVMVYRKGYMFKDKIIRPAMVQVAKDE